MKNRIPRGIALLLGILALWSSASVLAETEFILVPLFGSSPRGVNAIPVYCNEAITSAGELEIPNCYRSDTREQVERVPAGHFLFVTDITVSPNSLATTGRAILFIGVDDGLGLPS